MERTNLVIELMRHTGHTELGLKQSEGASGRPLGDEQCRSKSLFHSHQPTDSVYPFWVHARVVALQTDICH